MKRAPRVTRRAASKAARSAVAPSTKPGWLAQHINPNRSVRRAWAAVMHDNSGKNRVRQIARIFSVPPDVAVKILEGATFAVRSRTPLRAADAESHEATRVMLGARYCGGRPQAIAFNEEAKPKKPRKARKPVAALDAEELSE